MKRLILSILLLTGLHTLQAQDFRFGVKAEPGISWYNSNDENLVESNGSNLSFEFGLNTEYYFAENYGITAGLSLGLGQSGNLIFPSGGNLFKSTLTGDGITDPNNFDPDTEVDYQVTYVTIPIGFKMKTDQIGYMSYFVELPIISLDFRTSANGDISSTTQNSDGENITEDVNLFQVSWGLGLGAEYAITDQTSVVAGFYYKNGILGSVKDQDAKITPSRISLKTALLF